MTAGLILALAVMLWACVFLAGFLVWGCARKIEASVERAANGVAGSAAGLARQIADAGRGFEPVRRKRCTKCGGTGEIEEDNPLFVAIAESLRGRKR